MKDFTENKYPKLPDGRERTYFEICKLFKDGWNDAKPGTLAKLVASMARRCQAVIDTGGRVTNY